MATDKKENILVCGSLAFDHLLFYKGQFSELNALENSSLNISLLAPVLRREFGGCAGNIVHVLNQLKAGLAVPMGVVGHDFTPYVEWMDKHGIDRQYILTLTEEHTAQAFITSDEQGNQFTVFHPGAMNHAHLLEVNSCPNVSLGIVSPDGRDGMLQHAAQFVRSDIPFVFDPGQGLGMFTSAELKVFLHQATWAIANEHEWKLFQDISGLSLEEAASMVRVLIVTRGKEGSLLYLDNGRNDMHIPPVKVGEAKDPTGCGDAYRAGLLYGLFHRMNGDMEWNTIGNLASLLGAIQVTHEGTQNIHFTVEEIAARFHHHYGYHLHE